MVDLQEGEEEVSRLRPELVNSNIPSVYTYASAFFRVLQAVKHRRALIHGQLHDGTKSCAIGCAYDEGVNLLPNDVVDEIATYNDSFPRLSAKERWKRVRDWLEFRCEQMRKKKP